MPTSLHRLQRIYHAYRERAELRGSRREHDDAIAVDARFALEHRLQVARSIDAGRGGCPFCG
jgi:hypothetical protein